MRSVRVFAAVCAGWLAADAGARAAAAEPVDASAVPAEGGEPQAAVVVPVVPIVVDEEAQGSRRPRTAPALVSVEVEPPAPEPRRRFYRSWLFWTLMGSAFAGVVAITYAVTRPPPAPYYGNAVPNFDFP